MTVGSDPTLGSDFLPLISNALLWSLLGWGLAQKLFVTGVALQVISTICFGIVSIFYFAIPSPSEMSSLYSNHGDEDDYTEENAVDDDEEGIIDDFAGVRVSIS